MARSCNYLCAHGMHWAYLIKRLHFISIGKKRRLTFIECGSDLNSMIDTAKAADLVRNTQTDGL